MDPCGTPQLIFSRLRCVSLDHTNLVSVKKIGFKPIQSRSTNPVEFKFIQENLMGYSIEGFGQIQKIQRERERERERKRERRR